MAQWFTAEQSNISVTVTWSGEEAVSDQNIDFKDVENDSFMTVNMSWMYWEMSSDKDSDDGIKHPFKLNPSKLQKVAK